MYARDSAREILHIMPLSYLEMKRAISFVSMRNSWSYIKFMNYVCS